MVKERIQRMEQRFAAMTQQLEQRIVALLSVDAAPTS